MSVFQQLRAQGDALLQAGRPGEAAAAYSEALRLKPDFAEALFMLGMALGLAGRADEALAVFDRFISRHAGEPQAYLQRAALLAAKGDMQRALDDCDRAAALAPQQPEIWSHRGLLLESLGRDDGAMASWRRALALKPDQAEVHGSIAGVLARSGKLDDAAAAYRTALALKPDYAEAHNNLGNVLKEQGRPEEALAQFRRTLALRPDLAEAHNNLGNTLSDLGRTDEAAASYRAALAARPDFALAADNLALLLCAQGRYDQAMAVVRQSLARHPTPAAKTLFVECARHLSWSDGDAGLRALVVRALMEPWGRPGDLSKLAISLIRPRGAISPADPLLHALLISTPIYDVGLEQFLTAARRDLLAAVETGGGIELDFSCALARQCFINEYVYGLTAAEEEQASALRQRLEHALEADAAIAPALLAMAGAYFPLFSLSDCEKLLERTWPPAIHFLLIQQLREPLEERRDRDATPRLTEIADPISRAVRRQYEENPFPRWIKTVPAVRAKNLVQYFADKFPLASFRRPDSGGPVRLLVAGCGTGQQAIETGWEFANADVLAVDLSLASLAYGRRKTAEMGLAHIRFAQADLLALREDPFDVISATGVLHHLADWRAGWRHLLSLLRPGGFMKVALYSSLARRHVLEARAYIARKGYGPSADGIRRLRQDLMAPDAPQALCSITGAADFFSLSMCRDLLFHVQEHCLSLPEIAAFLDEQGVTFLGFDMEPHLRQAYRTRFPNDPAATDLAQWNSLETDNPDSFTGMYQFWIQKP